ncbi:MAG: hypothetical protein K2J71_01575, partial [Oscillospiraceae bacterium]|nr:hypothetical protein [Oscillospiraceae bacterium]
NILLYYTDCGLIINYKADHAKFALHDITNSNEAKVGTESMFIELGEFYGPTHNAVFAYLAFDEDHKLIEIHIRRDVDGF